MPYGGVNGVQLELNLFQPNVGQLLETQKIPLHREGEIGPWGVPTVDNLKRCSLG